MTRDGHVLGLKLPRTEMSLGGDGPRPKNPGTEMTKMTRGTKLPEDEITQDQKLHKTEMTRDHNDVVSQ